MHLSDHSLSQLDEAYVQTLDAGQWRGLSLRLLEDLKEARERLRQNPNNSSRPPSSRAPWERPPAGDEEADATTLTEDKQAPGEAGADANPSLADAPGSTETPAPERAVSGPEKPEPKCKAGKQPGAPGIGRTQVLKAHATRAPRPGVCAVCAAALPGDAPRVAYAGFQSVDLVWGVPSNRACTCGSPTIVSTRPAAAAVIARAHVPAKVRSRIRR